MNNLILALASGFGSGYLPGMPGTWGTLAAMVVYWFLPVHALLIASLAVLITIISVPVCGRAEKLFHRVDDGRIVIDEWAGYFVAVVFVPHTPGYALAAFALFRFFDVVKPFGIRSLQKLPGGWGVTVDDVAAGLLVNGILQIAYRGFGI